MMKAMRVIALLLAAALPGIFPISVHAQQPQEVIPAPRFDINRFDVTGNTLLPAAEVESLLTPFTGSEKDFSDIQRALEALEQAYRDLGFGVVQVLLPEQDITRGVVQFRVVQPRIGRIAIEGNTHFDSANVRRSLPSLREGEVPNSREIARNLQLAAEHPVKQTNVLLRSGQTEETVDVNVKVNDDRPWRRFVTLDNTGTGDTGYYRLGVGFQHTNLFNRDHALTMQYVTSPTNVSKVSIYGAGYRIPYYNLNSSLDLIAGYSDVNSGVVQGLFNVAGSGTIGAARWNTVLPKWGEVEHKISLGMDYRAFENEVLFQNQNLTPDITVHPISLTYSGLRRMTAADFSYYVGVSHNIPGGNDGKEEDWRNGLSARQAVTDDYKALRFGFNYARQFRNEWQMRIGFNAQFTRDALVSGEQFGIGGPDSVRGYALREVSNDWGYSTQAELYTPDFAKQVKLSDTYKLRALAFYDWGTTHRNKDPGPEDSLSSVGVGLRLSYGKMVNFRLDLAQILQESPTHDNNTQRLTGALAIVF
jgi:hemolysin activation/secretion protein